jgi:outer membrane receptor protein involved in Fe transport
MRASMLDTRRRGSLLRFPRARRSRLRAIAVVALALAAGRPAASEELEVVEVAQAEDAPAAADEKPPATSGDSDEAPPGVEVITVKGRTAAAIETDVPASITQFDASTIQAIGAQNISDLARVTPNVQIVQPGATQATFYVRGIGLQSFDANATGAVTIFQDGVGLDLPALQTGQLFDVHNVEIVRGPQGTGPYRNASGGAISVSSNLPTGNYGAQLRSSIGRYAADGGKGAHHGVIQDYEGYVEAPILRDALSSRFAFRLRNAEPFQTNGCGNAIPFSQRLIRTGPPQQLDQRDICGERGSTMWPINQVSRIPMGLARKVDKDDNWAARGIFRFQPQNTDLDFVLNGHGSRLDEDQTYGQVIGTGGVPSRGFFFGSQTGAENVGYWEPDARAEFESICGVFPPTLACGGQTTSGHPVVTNFEKTLTKKRPLDRKPYRGDYDRDGVTQRDTWGTYLSGKAEIDEIEVFAVASYDGYKRFRDQDTDFTPDVLFEIVEDDDAWQTWNEVHVGGELPREPLQWEIGGYYFQAAVDSTSTTQLANLNRIERTYGQDTESFGTWGKFTWDFLDDVTLEGGVRWNWEKKDFDIERQLFLGGGSLPANTAVQDETWQTPTGNLTLTYHFNQEVSAFAKYSRGFKAGHFNALASENVNRPPADPEYNDAWEAGLAGAWFDRRLSASLSYFYYRYQDYQIFLFRSVADSPPVLEVINAHRAENYGIEIEAHAQPLRGILPRMFENLLLTANAGWLHGEFLDFQIRSTQLIGQDVFPVTIDFSGDQLTNAPEFKVSGAANWTFDFGRWGSVIPRYDFSWTDDVFFGLNDGRGTAPLDIFGTPALPEFATGQAAYWIHNVRFAYRTPTGNVEFAFFIRNLTDEVYKTYAFDASNFSNVVLNFTGVPRTIGFDLIVTF